MKSFAKLTLTVCLTTLVSSLALSNLAMAVDFNTIINENTKAQNELHTQIKETVDQVRLAVQSEKSESEVKYIAEVKADTFNVPTNKDVLKFNKEKSFYKPSQAKTDKRLAQEIQDLE